MTIWILAAAALLAAGCAQDMAGTSPTPDAPPQVAELQQGHRPVAPAIPSQVPPASAPSLVPETDCTGLLEQRDIFGGKHTAKHMGRYAAGSMVGSAFTPMLYFNQLSQARSCAPTMEIREWRKDQWVKT